MSGVTEAFLVEQDTFFAPMSSDAIDGLIGQYQSLRKRIDAVAEFVGDSLNSGVIHYFIEGNCDDKHGRMTMKHTAGHLFDPKGAVAALDSAFWSKAMHLTDVLDYMPQKRRDEWNKAITEQTCPEFDELTVRNTLMDLLNLRSQFLAERVDGIFRGLSGEHVTNSPAAFGKRMIVAYVLNEHWSESYSKCGLINDLRCVVAKFMGRDEPKYNASSGLIRGLKGNWGQWMNVDGGALKIRLYKKGTAHIEVHPDMAWRLNATLAHLYPLAIPAEFRVKPARKAKEVRLIQRPLPFAVIDLLAGMKQGVKVEKVDNWRNPFKHTKIRHALQFDYDAKKDPHILAEAEKVIESLGGVKQKEGYYQFDYDATDVLHEVVLSGCVPDHKSHQYYPTPDSLAELAVGYAQIGDEDICLEPSAGQGGLAKFLPVTRTKCVEVSGLHCEILKSKGFDVDCADFLQWQAPGYTYGRVVMNPPFDRGQWQAHLSEASTRVAEGGRLVAILPSGAKTKAQLPGFKCEFHGPFDNEFSGASVSVVILVADRVG